MKKPFIALIAIFACTLSHAQIDQNSPGYSIESIGKVSTRYKYIELSKQEINGEYVYNLKYHNLEFPEMRDMTNVRFRATDRELDDLYNKILIGSKLKKSDPITYINLDRGRLGISRLTSGQVKLLYNSKGSNEIKWTWLTKGQLRKVFGK
tara:strand:- start:1212 stop:1664 length:453 start_codon:yes stop_codon:yes gene_type:complete